MSDVIEVVVYSDGVECSRGVDIAWPNIGEMSRSQTATHHIHLLHASEDLAKSSVAGPMPRKVLLDRQTMLGVALDHMTKARQAESFSIIAAANDLADALVAAGETR